MVEVCLSRGWRLELVRGWSRNSVSEQQALTFSQANCQAMGSRQLQDVEEVLNMKG